MIESFYRAFFTGTKYRTLAILSCLIPFSIFFIFREYNILRINMIFIHSFGCILAGLLFFYEKRVGNVSAQFGYKKSLLSSIRDNIKCLDIELTILITLINQILLYFCDPAITVITGVFLFIFLLLFLIRQLKIPIKNNKLFFICYCLFYFILNFKYLDLFFVNAPIFSVVNLTLTIVLAILFSYALLAISKSENIYRSTFLSAAAVLCLVILGERMTGVNGAFLIAHVSCIILMSFSYMYWYEGKECYIEITGQRKKIFDIEILPNLIGALTFLLYICRIDIERINYVWALIAVVFIWYLISIFKAIKIISYPEEALVCEGMSEMELNRLNNYATHLKRIQFMKTNFKKEEKMG